MLKHIIPILRLWIALGLLAGCNMLPAPQPASPPIQSTATASPTQTATQTASPTLTQTLVPTASPEPTATEAPHPAIQRVLIISLDGLRPDAIALAPMPTVQALMETGAYTLNAQTIFPSSTLPSHASMLTGLCPAKHGVDWNDDQPERGYAKGPGIFAQAKLAGMYTIFFAGKSKMKQLTPPETLDFYQYINDRDLTIAAQAIPILQKGFDLAFIHFPTPDGMGHAYGWLSPQQLSVIRRADEAIANILAGLEESGLRENTLVIISADHGGHEQTHGWSLPEDMTIPWIANGPGIIPMQISGPVNTTDTAATTAWALRLPIPTEWDGVPLLEIFGRPARPRLDPRCP